MPWSHNLKAQKAESTEQCSSVISVLVETDEHVLHSELLFSKLEKNCKTVLAPLRQSTTGNLDVEVVVVQHCSPTDVFGICKP